MAASSQHRTRRVAAGANAEFGSQSGEYELTELKNVATGRNAPQEADDFLIRFIHAIKDYPCFYDTNDEHYGNRHSDALFRQHAWQEIIATTSYTGDAHSLSQQWRKLRERYVRERKKGPQPGEDRLADDIMAEMSWLDEFTDIGTGASRAAAAPAPQSTEEHIVYMDGLEEDILGEFVEDEYIDDARSGSINMNEGRRSPAGSNHSQGSDIDVGSAAHTTKDPGPSSSASGLLAREGGAGGGGANTRTVTLAASRMNPSNGQQQTFRILNPQQQQGHTSDGGLITVTGRGHSGGGGIMTQPKREGSVGGSTLTMVIDPTTYYQNGTQKMYRLVNVADLDQSHHTTSIHTLRGGGGGASSSGMMADGRGEHQMLGRNTRKRMAAPLSPPSHNGPGLSLIPSSADHHSPYGKSGQLGDDLILDDGIVGESTIVIDQQRDDDSPLLVDSPGMHHHMMMPSTSRGMRGQHSPPMMVGNGRAYSPQLQSSSRLGSSSGVYNPATQYDNDLQLQQFISSHLARLNEDDKALAKMNIQRILLDARFGVGTTARICMGDEEAELDNAAVASELVNNQ